MKKWKLECWYRYDEDEKDFFTVEIYADTFEDAVKEIKSKDRRIFKVI